MHKQATQNQNFILKMDERTKRETQKHKNSNKTTTAKQQQQQQHKTHTKEETPLLLFVKLNMNTTIN
jgi:hypothetical protein